MELSEIFVGAAAISFVLCYPVRRLLLHWEVLDLPNARSSHSYVTVRGGGTALIMACGIVEALLGLQSKEADLVWIIVAALIVAVVSFLDDIRSIHQAIRLGAQAVAALLVLYVLLIHGAIARPTLLTALLGFVGLLWIVGYTNAFNFMDGINGLAGMQLVATGLGTGIIGIAAGGGTGHPAVVFSITLAGAGAGFLPHNFPNARLFLGDVGSATVGFLLAILGFWLARDLGWWLLGAFGLLHANFVLDTIVTFGRRLIRGDRCFAPHREHFYQRFTRAGRPHWYVTSWEAAIQVVVVFLIAFSVRMAWAIRISVVVVVCAAWILFFQYIERVFRKSPETKAQRNSNAI